MAMAISPWPKLPARHRLAQARDGRLDQYRGARRARAGEPGKLWVVAATQESGRGRRGRVWVSPAGNLVATS